MKHVILLVLGLSTILFASCNGDDSAPVKTFADYTRADVMAEETKLTSEEIPFDAAAVQNFKAGSIIFFKTSSGKFGKIQVLEVKANSDLLLNLVVFDANGAKILDKANYVLVLSAVYYDLDNSTMPIVNDATADFGWTELMGVKTLNFGNGAKAFLFKV